nr:cysteine-rich receptor-like protein kinase 25 [Ipomoea batatas]
MLLRLCMLITLFMGAVSQYDYRYFCPNTSTNTPTYTTNVKSLLRALSSKGNVENGFYNFTAGHDRDTVYGMFMCQGDISTIDCAACINQACSDILRVCSEQKTAVIWFDHCMLRFSDEYMFQKLDKSVRLNMSALEKNSEPGFMQRVVKTSEEMTRRVAGNLMNFGTYEANFSKSERVYSLGQCTPDISEWDCQTCLKTAVQLLPTCCDSALGARVLSPSCYVRYEIYPFYSNKTTASAPAPTSGNLIKTFLLHLFDAGSGNSSSKLIIATVIPAIGIILLFISIFCFLRVRNVKKRSTIVQTTDVTTVSVEESTQYDFATIKAITNDFSPENKIGEGGYGSVYQGLLPIGQEVAVKRLSRSSGQGAQEFKNEVEVVAKLQYRNLAWEQWRDSWPLKILDPALGESYAINEVVQCVHIGLLCVQEDADERPTMTDVMLMLNSYSTNNWLTPHQPAFYRSSGNEKMLREIKLDQSMSVNEVSISELYPR